MQGQIEQLFRHYYKDLRLFLAARCPDAHMIDDIIQNTFLQALRSIERFNGDSSLKTWLFGIAKHELYRSFRKNREQLSQLGDLSERESADHAHIHHRVVANEIMASINRLSPPLDEIMRLRLVHELSFKEIGLRVGRSENYCRVNFFRARQKMREAYHDEHV